MIVVLTLAAALQQIPAAAPDTSDDIVVLGKRLQEVGVRMKIDRKGRLRTCSVTKSVDDADLDRFWCDAGVACAATRPKDAAALTACVEGRRGEFLERLAQVRAVNERN
ncbi:MAG: hypothetical protein V4564_24860 [Pseudomonadota bacterium]